MTKLVLDALKDHCRRKGLSNEDLFKQVSGGKAKVNEPGFVAFLEQVPGLCSREDLAFSKEDGAAIFAVVDTDHDGFISLDDFRHVFLERFRCVHGIAIMDSFDISAAETLERLE